MSDGTGSRLQAGRGWKRREGPCRAALYLWIAFSMPIHDGRGANTPWDVLGSQRAPYCMLVLAKS